MISGVIFDADGTLIDSMSIWHDCPVIFLESLGMKARPDIWEKLGTLSLMEGYSYIKEAYGLSLSVSEIADRIQSILRNFYYHEVLPKQGVIECLEYLKCRGIPMIIATSGDKDNLIAALKRLDLYSFFEDVITCDETGLSKRSREIFDLAAGKINSAPKNTIVVEDAEYALTTAKNAGFKTIAVHDNATDDFEKLKELSDAFVDFDCTDFIKAFKQIEGEIMKTALTIAGSDSSGGAGIQADIKTMQANGVFAMSAITALTAQNTTGVRSILNSTPEFLADQIDAIFTDIRPDAVKIGMVSSVDLINVIADKLTEYKAENIVVDPVMVATSGAKLISDDAVATLTERLLPLATVITPNIPEAEELSGMSITTEEEMIAAAKLISEKYNCSVLLKGGHKVNDANDLLYRDGDCKWFIGKRIDNPNTHGTGCTLSSAIASNLAKGKSLDESVGMAKEYISGALSAMLDLGAGSGPMNHGFDIKGRFAE